MKRPAESAAGGTGVVAGFLIAVLKVDPVAAGAIAIVVGAIPGAVSYVVDHGGLAGVWQTVFHGKKEP